MNFKAFKNNPALKAEIVEVYGKSPFKTGWFIALNNIVREITDEV